MKLMVIVLCLLSERFVMHSLSYRRFFWFSDYSQRAIQLIERNFHLSNPWIVLAAIVAPICLAAAFLYFLLHGILFGFVGLILSIVIFFYCIGPQNPFYPSSDPANTNQENVSNYLAMVNGQLFAVIFWYILAGPIAVVFYRVCSLSQNVPAVTEQAKQLTDILEWIPARLSVLLYLLVGNFQRGFAQFMHYFVAMPSLNNQMLRECGILAVRSSETEEVPMPVAESLVEHAVVVFTVLIALFTLVAWM